MTERHHTRDWRATDTLFTLDKRFNKLVVNGQVQTLTTAEHPQLEEIVPQGINPSILMLDLKIPSSGIGGDIVEWRTVSFEKEFSGDAVITEVEVKGAVEYPVKIKVHQLTA